MIDSVVLPPGPRGDVRWPPLGAHRLIGDGRSCALSTQEGEIDWWCAPDVDDPPLLWSLLDRSGAAARWRDVEFVAAHGGPAGPTALTTVRVGGTRVRCRDGLVLVDGRTCLVRLARAETGSVTLEHEVAIGGFDREWATAGPDGFVLDDLRLRLVVVGVPVIEDGLIRTTHEVTPEAWTGVVLIVGDGEPPALGEVVAAVDRAENEAVQQARRARLSRHHPERAADALAVLTASTYRPTGAVFASPTTSLPEAPGADRQFDYRYCWLRDAALAVSVASLLGRRDIAEGYLSFVRRVALPDPAVRTPVVNVRGGPVPPEREIPNVAGWRGSRPVRVGNAARQQLQYDAWGLVLEAVSVHLQTGGSLDDDTWDLVRKVADRLATSHDEESSGIWELRTPKALLSGDIGRWVALDRALWIARGWHPLSRRRPWKRARDEIRRRALDALEPDGSLPQSYGDGGTADASALMVVLFGMVRPRTAEARRLVDSTLEALEQGPFLRRYPGDADDGFRGREGAFLPVTWWAVAALAATAQLDRARRRLDELCARLPRLLSEEVDPVSGESLGNTPLVWSHMELARALYIVDAESIRRRVGSGGLWAWRVLRFARLRWGRRAPEGRVPLARGTGR